MPSLSDYEELDLSGLEIDGYQFGMNRLRANFGRGYGASASNGHANGLWNWSLSSQVVADDADYNDQIDGVPSFEYYYNFFKEHTTGSSDVFVIEWRGHKYLAEFVDSGFGGEMHTIDLFSIDGIEIRQRRVTGFTEWPTGGIFEPDQIVSSFWGWYDEDSFNYFTNLAVDKTASLNNLDINGDIDSTGTVQNGLATQDFNSGAGSGFLNTPSDPVIYEAFFALKINEATFAAFRGLLSASATTVAMVGNTADTKLLNLTIGSSYSFWKNGVELTEATQNMPMNAFGVVHARFESGITLTNLQIGKDRAATDRYLKADMGEIVLCDVVLTDEESTALDSWLMKKWGVA